MKIVVVVVSMTDAGCQKVVTMTMAAAAAQRIESGWRRREVER